MSLDVSRLVGVKVLAGKITAQCPICQERSQSHLVIFPDGKFGCVVDQSETHRSAIWKLVSGDGTMPIMETFPQIEIERTWPLDILDRLIKDYSYWIKRGISEETIRSFRGGIATEGQMKSRWVFPIFNQHDEIIGFTGRALKPDMELKWKHLGKKSKWIWGGLDEGSERLILVESIGDALALREHGVPETRCMFGTSLSEVLLGNIIATNPAEIVISTNLDEEKWIGNRRGRPGQESAERVKKILDKFFNSDRVKIVHPWAKDFGEMTEKQIKEWEKSVTDGVYLPNSKSD